MPCAVSCSVRRSLASNVHVGLCTVGAGGERLGSRAQSEELLRRESDAERGACGVPHRFRNDRGGALCPGLRVQESDLADFERMIAARERSRRRLRKEDARRRREKARETDGNRVGGRIGNGQ